MAVNNQINTNQRQNPLDVVLEKVAKIVLAELLRRGSGLLSVASYYIPSLEKIIKGVEEYDNALRDAGYRVIGAVGHLINTALESSSRAREDLAMFGYATERFLRNPSMGNLEEMIGYGLRFVNDVKKASEDIPEAIAMVQQEAYKGIKNIAESAESLYNTLVDSIYKTIGNNDLLRNAIIKLANYLEKHWRY